MATPSEAAYVRSCPSDVHFTPCASSVPPFHSILLASPPPVDGKIASFDSGLFGSGEYTQSIHFPSGETTGYSVGCFVIWVGWPPSIETLQRPGSLVWRATHFPSGEHDGIPRELPVVSWTRFEPSALNLNNPKVPPWFESATMCRPSPHTEGFMIHSPSTPRAVNCLRSPPFAS